MGLDLTIYSLKEEIWWRKSYEILGWFENRFRKKAEEYDVVFDIENYFDIYTDDLKDLLKDINLVLEDHSKAHEILPIDEVFKEDYVTGITEYDERYFKDLEGTKIAIENLLSKYNDSDGFVFRALF